MEETNRAMSETGTQLTQIEQMPADRTEKMHICGICVSRLEN
jgi:hypothetical protein